MNGDTQDEPLVGANYSFERIVNGWLATLPNGEKFHCQDAKAIIELITGQLAEAIGESRHFEWDGKFRVVFGTAGLPINA